MPANYTSDQCNSKRNSEGEESDPSPAIWNELRPYTATVAWRGMEKRMERQTEKEWKAVGGRNGFKMGAVHDGGDDDEGKGIYRVSLVWGYPSYLEGFP